MSGPRIPGGGSPRDPRFDQEAQRQYEDQQLLEQGDLPRAAQERLAEIGKAGANGLSFTSDLNTDEAGLLRRHGFDPLCLVTGSCIYHVGFAYASSTGDCEVAQLSDAYIQATQLAVERMELEAKTAHAHGVVGVRYAMVRHEWADRSVEVQLVGTAVRGPGPAPATPFLCDLSGQEWWALWRAGYEPAALVYGHCTWFILTTFQDEWNEANPNNQELYHFSQALAHCRNRASAHMERLAKAAHATGVVGVHIARRLDEVRLSGNDDNPAYEREHHNLVLSMIGTAIRVRPNAPERVPATRTVLSLRSGKLEAQDAGSEAAFV
jgi:uncharacterized protein YbjQ (UPF0145 family)